MLIVPDVGGTKDVEYLWWLLDFDSKATLLDVAGLVL